MRGAEGDAAFQQFRNLLDRLDRLFRFPGRRGVALVLRIDVDFQIGYAQSRRLGMGSAIEIIVNEDHHGVAGPAEGNPVAHGAGST